MPGLLRCGSRSARAARLLRQRHEADRLLLLGESAALEQSSGLVADCRRLKGLAHLVDGPLTAPCQLVDRPRGDGGLARLGEDVRGLGILGPGLLYRIVSGGGELFRSYRGVDHG